MQFTLESNSILTISLHYIAANIQSFQKGWKFLKQMAQYGVGNGVEVASVWRGEPTTENQRS